MPEHYLDKVTVIEHPSEEYNQEIREEVLNRLMDEISKYRGELWEGSIRRMCESVLDSYKEDN